MTEHREWPTTAKEARDRSAEEAAAIVLNLSQLLEKTNDPTVLRRIAISLNAAQTILRLLEREGAQTRVA